MATKQQIQNIKTNIERTVQGLRTKLQEFTYEETKGFVKPNTLSYEIEKSKSKYSVSEIISVLPSSERMNYNLNSDFKIPSREEYLKQSLSECRPSRNPKDIDETQQ